MSNFSRLPNNWSLLAELACLFCKSIDNSFSLEKYTSGRLVLTGDQIEFRRFFLFKIRGTIIKINSEWRKKFKVRSVYADVRGKSIRVCPRRIEVLSRGDIKDYDWQKFYDDPKYYIDLIKRAASEDTDVIPMPLKAAPHFYFMQAFDLAGYRYFCSDNSEELSNIVTTLLKQVITDADQIVTNYSEAQNTLPERDTYLEALRYKAYACLMLNGEVSKPLISEIARFTELKSDNTPPSSWAPMDQDKYLSAVRLAVLADELDLARKLLQSKRNFNQHKDSRSIIKKILRKSKVPSDDVMLRQNCFSYLNYVLQFNRGDCCEFGLTSPNLEWGFIVKKYFVQTEAKMNWANFFELVCEANYS